MPVSNLSQDPTPAAPAPAPAIALGEVGEAFKKVQTDYWQRDAREIATLQSQNVDSLPWPVLLRLHHLLCLELLHSPQGQKEFIAAQPHPAAAANSGDPLRALLQKTFRRLVLPPSPFAPAPMALWLSKGTQLPQRPPDHTGIAWNASLTHIAALEVIFVDGNTPRSLGFLGLHGIHNIVLAPPSFFRAARITFDDGRPPVIVILPLLYGCSWQSPHAYDLNGTMTRFCCHLNVGGPAGNMGIGLGHQGLVVHTEKGQSLIGLGGIHEMLTPLNVNDPKFEARCKARGLDPKQFAPVRQSASQAVPNRA